MDQLLSYQKFRSLIDLWRKNASELIRQINPKDSNFYCKFNEYFKYQGILLFFFF